MSYSQLEKSGTSPVPGYPTLPAAPWDIPSEQQSPEMPISFYINLLRRFRWRIATFVMFVTIVSTLIALVLPKEYASTAILRIDPSSTPAVNSSQHNGNIPLSARRLIATESTVITSPAVVLKTINQLRLYHWKQFAPHGLNKGSVTLTETQMNQVLQNVTKEISVNQPLNTYLLNVTFRSQNPDLSAEVANNLLHSLISHDFDTRVRALMNSSQSMRAQLIHMRSEMERSQKALIEYESTNDVLNPDSSNNIMLTRLSQVNQDLGIAQTKRMGLQADYQIVQDGDLDALIASDRGAYLLPIYARLLQDRRHLQRMGEVYGPKYPVYLQQQALVRHDQTVLRQQERHIANQIKAQYAMSRARERLLHNELNLQKRRMNAFNLKAIRYNSLKAASDSYTRLYYQLQQRIQDAIVAANLRGESLRIISPARPEQKQVFPRPLLTCVIAFLASSFIGILAAIAVGVLDKSVSNPEQIENWFGVPVLASLPRVDARRRQQLSPTGYGPQLLESGDSHLDKPHPSAASGSRNSAFREGILSLHSAIMLAQEKDLHILSISSSIPGEGKSTMSANLAAALAGQGNRTVLVDTDMRKPNMHRQFQISNRRGLSSLLRGQCPLDQVLVEIPAIHNLSVITAGATPPSPAELLQSGLSDVLEQLRARFEYILFDCPPILGFADTLAMANVSDGCIIVVHAGETERQLVANSLRQLRTARANILGIVLNNASEDLGSYYRYYSHYNKYYQHEATDSEETHDAQNA